MVDMSLNTAVAEVIPDEVVEAPAPIKLGVNDLTIRYGGTPALSDVNLDVREHEIFGIIGPANAGKTSFLKALNRMDTFNSNMSVEGEIFFNGLDVHKLKKHLCPAQPYRRCVSSAGRPAVDDL